MEGSQTQLVGVAAAPVAGKAVSDQDAAASTEPKKELSISIAQAAVDAVALQVKKRGKPETALRVGVKGGGCSGFSYVIEFHDGPPRARDRVYELVSTGGESVRVLVDPKSLIYLNGAELTWEKTLMRQGFKWQNPLEQTNCGCGHSFTV
jgi:iron-sulfur cluster assembly protein